LKTKNNYDKETVFQIECIFSHLISYVYHHKELHKFQKLHENVLVTALGKNECVGLFYFMLKFKIKHPFSNMPRTYIRLICT